MKRNLISQFLVIGLAAFLLVAGMGCNKTTGSENQETFSYWIPAGEDSTKYLSYDENPVAEYLQSLSWGPDETDINLDFVVPIAGSERDHIITLISTGEYPDIVDVSYYSQGGTVLDLYEQGIALDLTAYVEQYMPNYVAFLDSHPDQAANATLEIDGEKKYIFLRSYNDEPGDMWGGWVYRRDWIVDYGTQPATLMVDSADPTQGTMANPHVGEAFTGGINGDGLWSDDVVFPNGTSDPLYISDWEWMLGIFLTAVVEQNIIGGYPMSLYYPGYIDSGELVSAFGGGASYWYREADTIIYGATTDHFRTYLQCVNTWYDNDWIDKAFAEHTSEMFYMTDAAKVRTGKVGLWWGTQDAMDDGYDMSDGEENSPTNGYTNGMYVFGARQPINDIYGSEDCKNKIPFMFLASGLDGTALVITDKAQDKDLPALFTMLDYLFSEEGAVLATFGLSQAQYESTQNDFYTRHGLTSGAYTVETTEEGTFYNDVPYLDEHTDLAGACVGTRIFGLRVNSKIAQDAESTLSHSMEEWNAYPSTGAIWTLQDNGLSPEDSVKFSRLGNNVGTFLITNIPKFVNGTKDPFSDADWNAYLAGLGKYDYEWGTQVIQAALDKLLADE